MALSRLGRWSEAADAILLAKAIDAHDEYVVELDRQVAAGLLVKARPLADTNRAAARKLVDKAVEVLPDDPDVRLWLDTFKKAER
jgi:hypothetical protein